MVDNPVMTPIIALPLFGFLLLSACAGESPPPMGKQGPNAAHGKVIYQSQCAGCHDAGKNAPSIRDPEEWDLKSLDAPGIVGRHRVMRMPSGYPAPIRLSTQEEADVLDYIARTVEEAEQRY